LIAGCKRRPGTAQHPPQPHFSVTSLQLAGIPSHSSQGQAPGLKGARMTIHGWAIGMLALMASGQAMAQAAPQQTAEGAKTFLEKVLANGRYLNNTYLHDDKPQDFAWVGADSEYVTALGSPIPGEDKCVVRFSAVREKTTGSYWWSTNYSNIVFNFRRILDIKNEGNTVVLALKGNVYPDKFYAPSGELAVRIAYAMNFLKSSCNEIDKTGF